MSIRIYTSSTPGSLVVPKRMRVIKHIFEANGVEYEEVDLVNNMLERAKMLKNSGGVTDLPQVHVNNRYLGQLEEIQELEDFGLLLTTISKLLAQK